MWNKCAKAPPSVGTFGWRPARRHHRAYLDKQRILSRNNGNDFRDWEQSVRLNGLIRARRPLPNEYRIRADNQSPAEIADQICGILGSHKPVSGSRAEEYDRKDYGTYVTEYSDLR